MDKIAFYYELGYRTMLEKLATRKGKKQQEPEAPSALSQLWEGTKQTGTEMSDIYKKLLGMGPEGEKYFEALKGVYGKAGLPAKILAPTLPIAALGGAGYGAYKATKKKSKTEQLKEMLGLD